MSRFRWALVVAFASTAAVLSLLISAGPAQALMLKLTLEELSAGADAIIVGTVGALTSQWNSNRTAIDTSVTVTVGEVLKGTLSQSRISVLIPGGNVEGVTQHVSDVPDFEPGECAVLFLKVLPSDKFGVYGLFQGKLPVVSNRVGYLSLDEFKQQISLTVSGRPMSRSPFARPGLASSGGPLITTVTPGSASAGA